MTDDEKAPFIEEAKNDKARYQRQLDELKMTGSYFILDDGSKSTDDCNKKLFKA